MILDRWLAQVGASGWSPGLSGEIDCEFKEERGKREGGTAWQHCIFYYHMRFLFFPTRDKCFDSSEFSFDIYTTKVIIVSILQGYYEDQKRYTVRTSNRDGFPRALMSQSKREVLENNTNHS